MSEPQTTRQDWPVRAALRSAAFAERWFPDAYVFAVLGVVLVAACAIGFGASPADTVGAFGEGFWSLIPFTMQMAFVVFGGYLVATAPVVARFIDLLARVPKTGRGAICYVGLVSMLASLLSWGFSLVFGGLLVRASLRTSPRSARSPTSTPTTCCSCRWACCCTGGRAASSTRWRARCRASPGC